MSPLAGAPSRLVDALNQYTPHTATLLRHGAVAPGQRPFEPNAVAFNAPAGSAWDFCVDIIRTADIVHVHNQLPIESLRLMAEARDRPAVVFHVHSPPRERPNFFLHADFLPIKVDRSLVVPHFHPRCYWDYEMVPNIVTPPGQVPLRDVPPRLLFSPSHSGGGRWNRKSSPATERALEAIEKSGVVEVIRAEGYAPRELLSLRTGAALSLDEIETGSYHQVSVEALACGSVAINRADALAFATLRTAYRTDEDPPFLTTRPESLPETVRLAVDDADELWDRRQRSLAYFDRYMRPERLVDIYREIYESL